MSSVSQKYSDLIESGKQLFWKHGIRRVTIEEICEKANVSKMTFYKYFRNKDDFTVALLDQVIDESIREYKSIMNEDIEFEDKVLRIIKMKMEGVNDISKEFISDLFVSGNPEVISHYNKKAQESIRQVLIDFTKAQKKGEIRKDLKIEFLLYILNQMIDMINDESLISMYNSTPDLIGEIISFFFYGILPHPEAKDIKERI